MNKIDIDLTNIFISLPNDLQTLVKKYTDFYCCSCKTIIFINNIYIDPNIVNDNFNNIYCKGCYDFHIMYDNFTDDDIDIYERFYSDDTDAYEIFYPDE